MGIITCLDTHVLVWGIKREAPPSQQYMIDRTINFLLWLENEGHTVMVPAPVLAEFLMRLPREKHETVTRMFQSRFVVPSFDAPAASLFAQIWQGSKNSLESDAGLNGSGLTRDEIRVDSMIVAVAVINRANVIYSEDPHIQKIAKGYVDTRNIPLIPRQLNLEQM